MSDKRHRSQADDRPKPEPDVVPGPVRDRKPPADEQKKRSQEGNTAVDLPPGGSVPESGGPSAYDDEDRG